MKHLIRFDEVFDLSENHPDEQQKGIFKQELDELQEFTNNCLVYLLDEGFTFKVHQTPEFNYVSRDYDITYHIWLNNNGYFKWDAIKDHYIPFLQMLSRRYSMANFSKYVSSSGTVRFRLGTSPAADFRDYNYQDVIDDTIFDNWSFEARIYGIGTVVKSKKG